MRAQSGAARAVLLSTRVGVLDQCRGHASFVLHLAPRATPQRRVGTFLSFCFSTLFPIFVLRGKSAPGTRLYQGMKNIERRAVNNRDIDSTIIATMGPVAAGTQLSSQIKKRKFTEKWRIIDERRDNVITGTRVCTRMYSLCDFNTRESNDKEQKRHRLTCNDVQTRAKFPK